MIDIKCSDPKHPVRSSVEGWNNGVLAQASRVVTGMICPGCATQNDVEARTRNPEKTFETRLAAIETRLGI